MQVNVIYHERLESRTAPLRTALLGRQIDLRSHPILQHRRTSLLKRVDALPAGPRLVCVWTPSAVVESLLALVLSLDSGMPTHSVALVTLGGGFAPYSPLRTASSCEDAARWLTSAEVQQPWSAEDAAAARAAIEVDWHNAGHLFKPDDTDATERGLRELRPFFSTSPSILVQDIIGVRQFQELDSSYRSVMDDLRRVPDVKRLRSAVETMDARLCPIRVFN